MPNRLAGATSPYLLQHADNPVDWREWGEEAFHEARARDVPLLISIGYAACHWCHVMAHESFEDEATAAQMNENFVCVKVDREERPDVDNVYMTATQALTGHGGWPMTVLATPEGGFASALDADTEGVEGLTYVWTPDQLIEVLGPDDGRWAAEAFAVTEAGTFEHGASTLQL